MSPTIPPVLVLSLLLVSPLPTAEAGEMMDLFALIRGTLKYWRRVYQMYEEEVALGYCWAEYFLHREDDAKDTQMSTSGSTDSANLPLVELDDFGKGVWNEWVTSMNNGAGYRRGKRSIRMSNSTNDEGVFKVSGKSFDVDIFVPRFSVSMARFEFAKAFENAREALVRLLDNNGSYKGNKLTYDVFSFIRQMRNLRIFGKTFDMDMFVSRLSEFISRFEFGKIVKGVKEGLVKLVDNSRSYEDNKPSYDITNFIRQKTSLSVLGKTLDMNIFVSHLSEMISRFELGNVFEDVREGLGRLMDSSRSYKSNKLSYDVTNSTRQKRSLSVSRFEFGKVVKGVREGSIKSVDNSKSYEENKLSYDITNSTRQKRNLKALENDSRGYSRVVRKLVRDSSETKSNFKFGGEYSAASSKRLFENVKENLSILEKGSEEDLSKRSYGILNSTKKREVSSDINLKTAKKLAPNLTDLHSNFEFGKSSNNIQENENQEYNRTEHFYKRERFYNSAKEKENLKRSISRNNNLKDFTISNTKLEFYETQNSVETKDTLKKIVKENDKSKDSPVSNPDSSSSWKNLKSSKINLNSSSSMNDFVKHKFHSESRSAKKDITETSVSSKNIQSRTSIKEPAISHIYPRTNKVNPEPNKRAGDFKVGEDVDPIRYGRFPRNPLRRNRRSSGIRNSMNANIEEISKILENVFIQGLGSSAKLSKTKFKSNEPRWNPKSGDIDPITDGTRDTFSRGSRGNRSNTSKASSSTKLEDIVKLFKISSSGNRLPVQKSTFDASTRTSKVKLRSDKGKIDVYRDPGSTSRRENTLFPIVNRVGGSPSLVPHSSSEKQPPSRRGRLFSWKMEKMSRIDAEFKGTPAKGVLEGRSGNHEADTRRKPLYLTANRVTSDATSRPGPFEPRGSCTFSVENNASLNSRSKDSERSEKLDDNREPGDSVRCRKFLSSSLRSRGAEQEPGGSIAGNYRGNLRRKRDANDRIRSRLAQPLSKSGRATYNPTSLDEIPGFPSSYTMPGYPTWPKGIESRSISSRNDEETFERNVGGLFAMGIDKPSKTPIYYLKQLRDSSPMEHEPVAFGAKPLEGVQSVSSRLNDVGATTLPTFRASSSHVFSKDRSGSPGQRREGNLDEERGSKQLPVANDDRYRRVEKGPRGGKPVTERMDKKSAVRSPLGHWSSLLPVSYQRFMEDYDGSTSRTARNSSLGRLSRVEDQGRRSSKARFAPRGLDRAYGTLFYLRQAFTGFLRALGFFVNVGRQLMDYVDSNTALACTKDYLVGKAIHWIDS